ncbi:STAS-like domain-containing protein [Thalassotalea euphylliae]|uniref:DUF4325 domain-containing protein n=1 Tax=Thalassotalea euphylliae TaxID=1655234 RepID=A0A3E0U825_9GAMM|nr:STAS-like domain-containing protein [Thalassotalea euphylliae]REL27664.1 DUF4325 domain-containing protein [Thalassotalea euphylliae]REL32275.1 DUF4325 domain-containing protein [Thalassotalea euphylliae]
MTVYDLSNFSDTPFGRYSDDSKHNGTAFREILIDKLKQARQDKTKLIVDFDSIKIGIGSSFLEEAFGGLVRKGYFTKEELTGELGVLDIKSDQDFYKKEIFAYINEAKLEG